MCLSTSYGLRLQMHLYREIPSTYTFPTFAEACCPFKIQDKTVDMMCLDCEKAKNWNCREISCLFDLRNDFELNAQSR